MFSPPISVTFCGNFLAPPKQAATFRNRACKIPKCGSILALFDPSLTRFSPIFKDLVPTTLAPSIKLSGSVNGNYRIQTYPPITTLYGGIDPLPFSRLAKYHKIASVTPPYKILLEPTKIWSKFQYQCSFEGIWRNNFKRKTVPTNLPPICRIL